MCQLLQQLLSLFKQRLERTNTCQRLYKHDEKDDNEDDDDDNEW